MARNALPLKEEKHKGIYIPLWHVLIVVGLVLAIPPSISAINSWKTTKSEEKRLEVEELVSNALKDKPVQQLANPDASKAISELKKRLTVVEASDNTNTKLNEDMDTIKRDLAELNSRLLRLAGELEVLKKQETIPRAEPINTQEVY